MSSNSNQPNRKQNHRRNIARVVAVVAALSMGVGFIVPAMSRIVF